MENEANNLTENNISFLEDKNSSSLFSESVFLKYSQKTKNNYDKEMMKKIYNLSKNCSNFQEFSSKISSSLMNIFSDLSPNDKTLKDFKNPIEISNFNEKNNNIFDDKNEKNIEKIIFRKSLPNKLEGINFENNLKNKVKKMEGQNFSVNDLLNQRELFFLKNIDNDLSFKISTDRNISFQDFEKKKRNLEYKKNNVKISINDNFNLEEYVQIFRERKHINEFFEKEENEEITMEDFDNLLNQNIKQSKSIENSPIKDNYSFIEEENCLHSNKSIKNVIIFFFINFI